VEVKEICKPINNEKLNASRNILKRDLKTHQEFHDFFDISK